MASSEKQNRMVFLILRVRKKLKIPLICSVITLLIFISVTLVSAENNEIKSEGYSIEKTKELSKTKPIKFQTGFSGITSSGNTPSNVYYKPFVGIIFNFKNFKIFPTYYRYQNYQISDGNQNYVNINYNQIGSDIEFFATDEFKIFTKYYYSYGDANLLSSDYSFGIDYDLTEHSTVTLIYEGSKEDYIFTNTTSNLKTDIKYTNNTITTEYDYDITENTALDISYEYNTTKYNTLGYTYTVNTIRGGIIDSTFTNLIMSAGLNVGVDSSKYTIIGPDVRLTYKIFDTVRLKLFYLGQYYINAQTNGQAISRQGMMRINTRDSSGGQTMRSQSQEGVIRTNTTTSFWKQTIGFGVTFEY